MVETIRFLRRNLPHWLVAGRTYFVTVRLAGTLPRKIVAGLEAERQALIDAGCNDEELWLALHRQQFVKVETILDTIEAHEGFRLTDKQLPEAILGSIEWLQNEGGWAVRAATIMPTHIHIVLRNEVGRNSELLNDLERFKRFTGRRANQMLDREGEFWARDHFDHWCRTPEKVEAAVHYVRDNPVKGRLVKNWQDWPWTVR